MKNLAAFTEASGGQPPFISINLTDKGRVSFLIREPVAPGTYNGNMAGITLPPELGLKLLEDAAARLRQLTGRESSHKH